MPSLCKQSSYMATPPGLQPEIAMARNPNTSRTPSLTCTATLIKIPLDPGAQPTELYPIAIHSRSLNNAPNRSTNSSWFP